MENTQKFYKYVPHHQKEKWESAGWVFHVDLGFPHAAYSSLYVWPHGGEPVIPDDVEICVIKKKKTQINNHNINIEMAIDMKNTYAVKAQSNSSKEELDDYPTPPWATRALMEHVISSEFFKGQICWEPAANRRFMSRPLMEYFDYVMESDINNYGENNVVDFLETEIDRTNATINWIITNPPFNKAQQFIEKAQKIATDGVAVLTRTSFLEGIMRYQTLYMKNPPSIVAQFSERVPMVRGRMRPKGVNRHQLLLACLVYGRYWRH
jgi:hypothetical protein